MIKGGRPGGSVAWQYFSRVDNSSYASCAICGQGFRIPASGTTTNLINHLRDKHREIMIERHPELMPNAMMSSQQHSLQDQRFYEPQVRYEQPVRESPVAAEKVEPIEEFVPTSPPPPKEENGTHQGISASSLFEQNGESEGGFSQPAPKRFRVVKETSASFSKPDRSEEFRVLGSFVSSELRSAAEKDYNMASKASLEIQEILLQLKKKLLDRNE